VAANPEFGMPIVIRDAVPLDVERLNRIAAAAKAHWGYPPEWLELWSLQLTIAPADIERWRFRVAAGQNSEPLGFVAMSAAWPRHVVEHLWVQPGSMRQGIGRALLRDALELAGAAGALGLDIEADPHAAEFYLLQGGRPAGYVPAPMPGAPERSLPRFYLDIPGG
jgi:GNAT superfamily N-acetyltransferase